VQLNLTIDLRAVILGVVLLLVAAGIATPFAISLADDGDAGETSSAQAITAGTAFTYQGRLDSGGAPANGIYDFRFTLFDADTAGSAVAGPLSVNDVTVTDGLFTATLDFGAAPFAGSERWLVVEAKATASQTFDALTPRQPLSPVPYALFALSGGTQYTAGTGLTLAGTEFSVQFLAAGPVNGNATTSARSDHTHVNQLWTGSILASGSLGKGILTAVNTFSTQFGGFGFGLKGEAQTAGVLGVLPPHGPNIGFDLNSIYGAVVGYDTSLPCTGLCIGVSGFANSGTGTAIGVHGAGGTTGVVGTTFGSGTGVEGNSASGVGVFGTSGSNAGIRGESTTGPAISGETTGANDGVVGKGGSGAAGIYGLSRNGPNTNWAGYFIGNVNNDGTVFLASDARFKHDITALSGGLDGVRQLRPVSYALNEPDSAPRQMGFTAQAVQEIFPELVTEGKEGKLFLNYFGLIPVLTRAIQEQQAQIEALKASPEPRPSGALDTAPMVEAPVTVAPVATIIRQSVGPSSAAIYVGSAAVALFALGLFALAWRVPRSRSPLGR
jgi:hypothetical protein